MNDTETISSSRVLFGVAAAHKMLENVALHIEVATKPCLNRIVEWKDNRGDEFDKEIPGMCCWSSILWYSCPTEMIMVAFFIKRTPIEKEL